MNCLPLRKKNHDRIKRRLGMAVVIAVAALFVSVEDSDAQGRRGPRRSSQNQQKTTVGLEPEIVWYGSLNDGLKVAKETQRPIFLLSAAPQCTGVPGVW